MIISLYEGRNRHSVTLPHNCLSSKGFVELINKHVLNHKLINKFIY